MTCECPRPPPARSRRGRLGRALALSAGCALSCPSIPRWTWWCR
ncbi:hypothetical protein UO65_2218 [Actinokineospora spheciospongiae]|uniref:Uncharacterized protein n=1 Tax=Actinokineospora spheciospongiae TaxID=909613 RepID=W7J0L0_9PSEU|nr:hypothetical protein UO65_2218 [Actinokineospora spheciospongiae]